MKLLLIIVLYLILNQDTALYDKALDDMRKNSYFITLNIQSSNYTGRVIIENLELYYYFKQTKGYSVESYKDFMTKNLSNKEILRLDNIDLNKWGFIKSPDNNRVNKYATKGLEEFIKQYFEKKVIKKRVNDTERNAVISKLFELGVLAYVDDESGCLVITR